MLRDLLKIMSVFVCGILVSSPLDGQDCYIYDGTWSCEDHWDQMDPNCGIYASCNGDVCDVNTLFNYPTLEAQQGETYNNATPHIAGTKLSLESEPIVCTMMAVCSSECERDENNQLHCVLLFTLPSWGYFDFDLTHEDCIP